MHGSFDSIKFNMDGGIYEYGCILYVYFICVYIHIEVTIYLEPVCPLLYLQKEGSFPISGKTGKDEVAQPSQI